VTALFLGEGGGLLILERIESRSWQKCHDLREVTAMPAIRVPITMVIPDLSGDDASRVMADALKECRYKLPRS